MTLDTPKFLFKLSRLGLKSPLLKITVMWHHQYVTDWQQINQYLSWLKKTVPFISKAKTNQTWAVANTAS